jgi:hypothetical protein
MLQELSLPIPGWVKISIAEAFESQLRQRAGFLWIE